MIKRLDEIKKGETGLVKRVYGEGKVRHRLFDLGVTPGVKLSMRKEAPLGDPIELTIRGYELSLRKAEAANVEIEVAEEGEKLWELH